eukprot:4647193-Prymnesium_polylepis.1
MTLTRVPSCQRAAALQCCAKRAAPRGAAAAHPHSRTHPHLSPAALAARAVAACLRGVLVGPDE